MHKNVLRPEVNIGCLLSHYSSCVWDRSSLIEPVFMRLHWPVIFFWGSSGLCLLHAGITDACCGAHFLYISTGDPNSLLHTRHFKRLSQLLCGGGFLFCLCYRNGAVSCRTRLDTCKGGLYAWVSDDNEGLVKSQQSDSRSLAKCGASHGRGFPGITVSMSRVAGGSRWLLSVTA